MNSFLSRQALVLRQAIGEYRDGKLDLNSLIQRIEGVGDLLEVDSWRETVFLLVLSMEQINAATLNEEGELAEINGVLVKNSLLDLEELIKRFDEK